MRASICLVSEAASQRIGEFVEGARQGLAFLESPIWWALTCDTFLQE